MFLPKSKYVVSQATIEEYTLADGTAYTGPMFTTYKGETYAGESPLKSKGKIYSSGEGKGTNITNLPYAIRRVPTEAEYESGSMVRYFCQDLRTMKIVELLEDGYKAGVKAGGNFTYATGSWILTGSLEDYRSGNYMVPGVKTLNKKEIDRLEKVVPGISSSKVLCDPAQFVINTKKY